MMTDEKMCQGCGQRNRCQEVYRRMGHSEGPNVATKVLVAFLLPILTFIVCLAASESLLGHIIKTPELKTAVSFVIAFSVTLGVIFIARALNKRFSKKKPGSFNHEN